MSCAVLNAKRPSPLQNGDSPRSPVSPSPPLTLSVQAFAWLTQPSLCQLEPNPALDGSQGDGLRRRCHRCCWACTGTSWCRCVCLSAGAVCAFCHCSVCTVVVSALPDWMTPTPHQQMSTSFSCYTISIRQSKANQTNKWRSLVSCLSHYSWNRWFNKLLCAVLADTSLTQAVECVYNKIKITLNGTCNYLSPLLFPTSFTIKLSCSSLKCVQPAAGRISVVVSSPCQGDSFSCKTNERGYGGNGHRYRFGNSCVYR